MDNPRSTRRQSREIALTILFVCYAMGIWRVAHSIGHHLFTGWVARVITMACIALGLLPWGRWLAPRVMRVLGILGTWVMTGVYFVVLLPFAVFVRLMADPLMVRRREGSRWVPRASLPDTLDAARLEG
jgi:hypothetical protein